MNLPTPYIVHTGLGPVQVADEGSGRVLVALHGAMGGWDQSWILAKAVLGDLPGWRILAVSRPGYLETPLAGAETSEAQADLVAALLDSLGVKTATVAAISAGGPPALHFAVRHPDRCEGLILVSACALELPEGTKAAQRMRRMGVLARIPGFTQFLRRSIERRPERTARRAFADPVVAQATLADPEAGALFRQVLIGTTDGLSRRLPGSINDASRYARGVPAPSLDGVRVPVLLAHDEDDPVVPLDHARHVASGIPRAHLVATKGGGHFSLFSHLRDIRAAAAAFLS